MPALFGSGAITLVAVVIMSAIRLNNFLARRAGEHPPARPDEVHFWTVATIGSGTIFGALVVANLLIANL